MEGARADKWLWATRFFKTRSLAAETCSEEKVRRSGHLVKPATAFHVGDVIEIPFPEGPGVRTIKILGLIEKRVSAPLAQACYEDLTPPEVYEASKLARQQKRDAGGRPTKKERRDIGRIRGFWD
jgi:ribosome-associated heat shock protein Hsp15